MRIFLRLITLLVVSSSLQAQQPIHAIPVARGLTGPVYLTSPADGTNRLFVVEQRGLIKIIKDGAVLPVPFLDISKRLDKIGKGYSEKGLLGLAFHPDYKHNGKFYVYYSAPAANSSEDHHSVIALYRVSPDPNIALPESERQLMTISQPESNHNGGQILFGPEGYLYIGVGDGGGAGDKHGKAGNGQHMGTVLGKILRIDVNHGSPYAIPEDNPFVNLPGVKKEIWASGLRNPWRFSFDRLTQNLICADVGQNKWEEIDIIKKGRNYGWRVMEGNHCYESPDCNTEKYTAPLLEYSHDEGVCVVGGYCYRGPVKKYNGNYFFADWTGKFWKIESLTKPAKIPLTLVAGEAPVKGSVNSFGEDEAGNIYVVMQTSMGPESSTGTVWKLQF